jgi:N-acetylmuramoyl-L-alanine amidase
MIRKFPLKLVLGLAVALALQRAGAEPLKVTDVRFWSLGDVTRVAIQTNGEFRYRFDRLPNPDRLFFDLLGTKPPAGNGGVHVIPVSDRLLKQIRVAETQRDITRVVLDLEPGVEYTASQLSNPDRLVIELRPAGGKSVPEASRSVTGARKLVEPATAPVPAATTPAPAHAAAPTPAPATVNAPPAVSKPPVAAAPVAEPPAHDVIPQPAMRNRTGDRSLTRVLGLKLGRVVLDPGHGGHDTGSISPSGYYEKDLVLDVARRLGKLIERRMGSEVLFTRADDTFIPLEARTQFANDHKADLFLSIHANSSDYRSASGSEVYYLNFTTSKTALDVAARENASSERSLYELQELVQKIALKDKIEESQEFASRIQSAVWSAVPHDSPDAKDRGVKKAPFVVLIGASMPSVLVEIGFLSNQREEALLKKSDYRQRLAEALYKGVSQYASTLSYFQTPGSTSRARPRASEP